MIQPLSEGGQMKDIDSEATVGDKSRKNPNQAAFEQ